MPVGRVAVPSLSRRALILAATSSAALSLSGARFGIAHAQEAVAPAPAAPQQFSFDLLTQQMRDKAAQPFAAPDKISRLLCRSEV